MFDELTDKLEATFARLRGRGVLTEADIKEGLREVRRVLLEADVNFQLTREFLERVEQKAVGITQLRGINPAQQLVKVVYEAGATPLTYIAVGWLKARERIDTYDLHTDFNPLKLS